MIHLANLSVAFSGQAVIDQVSWHIGPRDRIGLVGNNGSGKSTLMRIIAGLQQPDEGDVVCAKGVTMGYLPQDGVVHEGQTLYDETVSVFGDLIRMQEEESELLTGLTNLDEDDPEFRRLAARYGDIQEELRLRDGYQLEKHVEKVLIGLGFSHDEMERDCGEFSGGWQMRIALAKVLLARPNMLLLDEPTNYLDLEARVFLKDWLRDYEHAILMVSHDRYFLDQVIGRITDIHDGNLSDYHCDYSQFLIEREERVQRLAARAERLQAERERIQAFINRFRYQANKAALVQSRVKQLEKLEEIKLPSVRKKIRFNFPQPERAGKVALEVENLAAGYGEDPNILNGVDFRLVRGEKVALVGVNGAGKSTLMKVLAGKLEPRSGGFRLGHNVDQDYFAQEIQKTLDPDATVYQTLERSCPFDMIPRLRSMLGAFLFSGDEIDKRVSVLSGGERNRLALARMLLAPSNLLLMDEPTNHLDLDAKEVLLKALQVFEGTVLFVSHDRYFLDHLATKIYAIKDGELYVYPGTYPDFLTHMEKRGDNGNLEDKVASAADTEKAATKAERVALWKAEKRQQREIENLEKKMVKLEEEIARREEKIQALLRQMAQPELAINFTGLEKLSQEKDLQAKELEKLSDEWEQSGLRLEELQESSDPS